MQKKIVNCSLEKEFKCICCLNRWRLLSEKNIIKFQFSEIFELAKFLQFLRLITLLAQNQKMNLIEREMSYIQMLDSFLRQQNIQSASKENWKS